MRSDSTSAVFEFAVVFAAIGGAGFGILGLITLLVYRRAKSAIDDPELPRRIQHFRDGSNLLALMCIVQAGILALPLFYRSPPDVPRYLAEPAIMGSATLCVVWVWAWSLLHRARQEGWCAAMTFWRRLGVCAPGVVFIFAVVAYVIKGVR
ncbi:MAG TPA: hypothetical protein VEK08_23725 [Planctomycetota bacterium]|nr:hypothetical protein [Planctomycetota bacterium]